MSGSHHHAGRISSGKMWLATAITFAFCVAEALIGYFANSLALMADAGHNFADALALGLSAYAIAVSQRRADEQHTFGHHRAGILAAFINALGLVVMGAVIFYEAALRLRHPEAVQSVPMMWTALAAIVLNSAIAWWLSAAAKDDLNIRSAYMHMLGDAAASLGVVLAGIVIALTGWFIADPIVSIVFALLVLWSSWGILKESVSILMESVPTGLDIKALERAVRGVSGVLDIHDMHVWTLSSGLVAGTCHLLVQAQDWVQSDAIRREVAALLSKQFNIGHNTIQLEAEHCGGHEHAALHHEPQDDREHHNHSHRGHTH